MLTRFTNITNALQALDKIYSNNEMVKKIIRCLPRAWMPKMIAIEEAKNLNTLPLEDIRGSLMTHEISIMNKDDDEEKGKRKKKAVALKSSTNEETEDDSYDELALITRRFKRFLASKKIEILEKENECLKIEVDALKKTFSNFSNSSEKLEKLLGMQRCVFDKVGLGYDEMNNVKHYQNFLDRKRKIEKEKEIIKKKNNNVSCNYCGKHGHISSACFYNRNTLFNSKFVIIKKIWVPIGIIVANPKGPKTYWAPETKF
ncbi:UBN2 domain-containing protein [Cephalotus follicularis]|uniref:UBN2 domain-containing protein n=1 Tax=Cephalotus follicularis TaxID=3775 RepID=A0A1Q3D3Y3_CEPFO|nr:UBN2 domain-containing protein [Cephalotus follicularis]